MKENLIKTLLEAIDLSKLASGLIDNVLEEALRKVVADSENSMDDMLMAAIYPVLEKEIKELIEKEIEELKAKLLS